MGGFLGRKITRIVEPRKERHDPSGTMIGLANTLCDGVQLRS